jgi:hypothetical protein
MSGIVTDTLGPDQHQALPRSVARENLRSLAAGAAIVREELTSER